MMGIEKEITVGLKENYSKVRKLLDEDCKHDPDEEPYFSKYAARDILHTMRNTITGLMEFEEDPDRKLNYTGMLSSVLLNIGIIAIDTEELSEGEKYLIQCLETLKDCDRSPKIVIIALTSLNQLGILWSHRENAVQSKVFLDKAEELYKYFKQSGQQPLDIVDLFRGPEDAPSDQCMINLEKTHTLTLYYLAQIYGSLEDYLKSAVYCHITLKRQLEYMDYEPIDWALNSATLSQFFMEKNGFKQARHHLAASSYILEEYGEDLFAEEVMGEAHDARVETFKHRSADVARCWVKYGLLLLSNSKDRLMSHTDDDENDPPCTLSSDLSKLQLSLDSSVSIHDLSDLNFPTLDLSELEKQITDQFILEFNDAKIVFINVQSWLEKAKKYYSMENLASDHVEIIQDASQLYKFLAFFEDSEERQAKMHKRRVDLLEDVIKDLNPLYYLQLCRQIWYELAETYSDILDIKLEKFQKSEERPTPQALKKINHLCEQSIKHFNNFLTSLEMPASHKMPKKFSPDLVKPSLMAYFHIGRLHMKMIVLDKQIQLDNIEESLKAYSKLVDYCDGDESAAGKMVQELSICREMVSLLPLKILRLKKELQLPE